MGTCLSKNSTDAVASPLSGLQHSVAKVETKSGTKSLKGTPPPPPDPQTAKIEAKNGVSKASVTNGMPPPHPTSANRFVNDESGLSASSSKSGITHTPGYSSGASTPRQDDSIDNSSHSTGANNPKVLLTSASVVGLDKLIEDRKGGDLTNNIVHMEVPFGKPIEEVYEGVHDGPVLGSGVSGLVRLCTHKATGARYAVKCLDLGLVETEEGLQQLREEIAIMCQLDHPNIVRLEEVYESHSEIYLVQELCVGGELFDRLDEQPDYHYSEAQCARLVKQMLCSVRYLHSKGIIHRDLKLENFLFSTEKADSELKMIDFGLSKHFQFGEVHHEAVGTPYTVAPEVIRGSYDERCDVWAIGVITYLLLSGDPPFGGCGGPESLFQVRSNILQGKFQFEPEDAWEKVSQEAKDFIEMLLVTDPNNRPTAKVCQKSPWLIIWANKNKLKTDNLLNSNVVKALVNFKEYSDMRKLLCEVLSFTLMPDQITDLRKEFEKLDTDGSGEISLRGLKQVMMQGAEAGSLGALNEKEVEDIFNAMRVRKTETRIHWHEFIAAGLSQCKVDERNLKLAFDRLDSEHKGYITFENVMELMGRDGAESEDEMRAMWKDSMTACDSKNAQITYEDFLLLMKGQTKYGVSSEPAFEPFDTTGGPTIIQSAIETGDLGVLHECAMSESTDPEEDEFGGGFIPSTSHAIRRHSSDHTPIPPSPGRLLPLIHDADDIMDMPPTMDDDNFDQKISDSADFVMKLKQEGTPPPSPFRINSLSPPSPDRLLLTGATLSPLTDFTRRRSRSVDDQDTLVDGDKTHFNKDIRRALPLPEHTHDAVDIEKVIHDETLTPLIVNRKLYRAHRKMRLAVLDASKRFEDQQKERTKAELRAKEQAESSSRFGAGLVMRHGHRKEVSSETIRNLMMDEQKKRESEVKVAVRKAGRAGRDRRARKKTVSDMSGMMNACPIEELKVTKATTSEQEPPSGLKPIPMLANFKSKSSMLCVQPELLHDITTPEPTIPGVFRETSDPFRTMGRSMMGLFGGGTEKKIQEFSLNSEARKSAGSLKISVSDGELHQLNDCPNTPLTEITENTRLKEDLPPAPPML